MLTRGALVIACALAALACRRGSPDDRAQDLVQRDGVVAASGTGADGACAGCHPEEAARFERSPHRLALRRIDGHPPATSFFDAVAPFDERAKLAAAVAGDGSPTLLVGSDAGASEIRPAGASDIRPAGASRTRHEVTHVMGGRRREDSLARVDGVARVLPVAWSVTRTEWVQPFADDFGVSPPHSGPGSWLADPGEHARRCSRCHPMSSSEKVSATPAVGMTCASCHAGASAHARARSAGAADPGTSAPKDAWGACGPCHATGSEMPRSRDLPADAPLTDRLLPFTAVGEAGWRAAFARDGRPLVPHGFEVQALAQSACHRVGGATCTTCHDPHGPRRDADARTSLRERDPDASCRGCHAAIAQDAAKHAKHPVATASVPLALDEPRGPDRNRLPGCVDCHAPAVLPFSPVDRVRDHSLSVPDSAISQGIATPDACAACHSGQPLAELAPALPAPGRAGPSDEREAWSQAFVTRARAVPSQPESMRAAAQALASRVADTRSDPWLRASAAHLLGDLGEAGREHAPALADAWRDADPVLARAAATAYGELGRGDGPSVSGVADPLRELVRTATDWRVRSAAGSALVLLGSDEGLAALEALHVDATLPEAARAEVTFELGIALVNLQRYRRGEAVLLECLQVDPGNVPAWVGVGVARAALGDAQGAAAAWGRALELEPRNPHARANLEALERSLEEPPAGP